MKAKIEFSLEGIEKGIVWLSMPGMDRDLTIPHIKVLAAVLRARVENRREDTIVVCGREFTWHEQEDLLAECESAIAADWEAIDSQRVEDSLVDLEIRQRREDEHDLHG